MNSSSSVPDASLGPVFILGRSLNVGGAERQMVQLAIGLKQRGYDVVVGLFYGGGLLDQELASRGIPIVDLGKRHRWDVAGFMFRLVRTLRRVRPSVVYAFLGTANTVAALARPFAPRFRLLWSVRASNMELAHYGWVSKLGYRLECALSRRPDLIVSNSRSGLEYAVANGFPRHRMVVVPNGIDTERFRPDPALRRETRAQWGLADDLLAVGVLARIDPMKDHATFLEAAARLAKHRLDVCFICIGEGDKAYTDRMKRLAASLGLEQRVLWTGASPDPVGPLNGLDILCSSSSEGEGFSNSVAEAMACGRSCVVTDVGDSAVVVGDTGWVVPSKAPDALADALLKALDAIGVEAGERARRRIVENFSVAKMVERTIACF